MPFLCKGTCIQIQRVKHPYTGGFKFCTVCNVYVKMNDTDIKMNDTHVKMNDTHVKMNDTHINPDSNIFRHTSCCNGILRSTPHRRKKFNKFVSMKYY